MWNYTVNKGLTMNLYFLGDRTCLRALLKSNVYLYTNYRQIYKFDFNNSQLIFLRPYYDCYVITLQLILPKKHLCKTHLSYKRVLKTTHKLADDEKCNDNINVHKLNVEFFTKPDTSITIFFFFLLNSYKN